MMMMIIILNILIIMYCDYICRHAAEGHVLAVVPHGRLRAPGVALPVT